MTTVWRIVIRASSALGVLLLMAGIPAGLLHFVGTPLPTTPVTWSTAWSTP